MKISFGTALLLCTLVGGCAVGPDWSRPNAPESKAYRSEPLPSQTVASDTPGGEAQRFVGSLDLPADWWKLFHSPALNALVERSLRHNPSIAAAQAALRQAEEGVAAQQGYFFPTLQAGVQASRQRNPVGTLAPTLANGTPQFNLYTPQLTISYLPDIFGLNRRAVESAKAMAEMQRFELKATYLTLASNVVVAAIQEASLRAQLGATQKMVALQTEQVALYRKRYQLGAIAYSDVVAQEAVLAQTRGMLPALKKALAQQRDLIAALAGDFPQQEPAETFDLDSLALPQDLPVTLPAKLVEQRPDVRAAEEQLHAASAQIGVATANLFPQFSLTGAMGGASTQISNVFATSNVFWAAIGSIGQTLFDGGTLTAHRRAAMAAYDQAAAQYKVAVLAACQNVADTLRALEFDAEAVEAQRAAEHSAADSLEIATGAEKLGSVSYLALIQAQQNYQQAALALIQAKVNRFMDTVALYQALGGGWWNKPGT